MLPNKLFKSSSIFSFLLIISVIFINSCETYHRAKPSILKDYIYPSDPRGIACAENATSEKNNCENLADSDRRQCLQDEREKGYQDYQQELNRYEEKRKRAQSEYDAAMRKWEYETARRKRCLDMYRNDPYKQSKCPPGMRRPYLNDFLYAHPPQREHYVNERNCENRYNSDKNRCLNRFEQTFVNICGGRIE
jgi:hypothetical protein